MQFVKECTSNRIAICYIDEELRQISEKVYWLTVNDNDSLLNERDKTELMDSLVNGSFQKKVEKLKKRRLSIDVLQRTEQSDSLSKEGFSMLEVEALFDPMAFFKINELKEYTVDCKSTYVEVTISEYVEPSLRERILQFIKKG